MQFSCLNSFLQRKDLYIRVQSGKGDARGCHFRRADGIRPVKNLSLQVGEVDLVGVGQRQPADAAGGEVEGRRAAQAAHADDQRMRRAQPLLPLDPDFVEQDVAAVAEELLVVQWAENLDSRFRGNDEFALTQRLLSSFLRPAWSARPGASGP